MLKNIFIEYNDIGDEGAAALATALENNKSLETLHISNNQITDVGALALIDALKNNETLSMIRINYNFISDDVVKKMKEIALTENFDIEGNKIPKEILKFEIKDNKRIPKENLETNVF